MPLNVVLINPRYREWSPNKWVPLGLGYIAAVLETEGNSVEIIDLNVKKLKDDNLRQKIATADVVGITGMITEFQEVLRIADIVKESRENTKVILGGPLATAFPKGLLQVSLADFVVMGEGERTIVNLISAIEQGGNFADVQGIAYRNGDQVIVNDQLEPIADLDTIPFPARHLFDMNRYLQNHFESFGFKIKGLKIKSTNLITSRGCPYSCTFCFKDMWGNKWRPRSPENIIREMEFLNQRYGVNGFFFNDDTFVVDKKRVSKFCQLLKESSLDIVWYCNGRVNLVTKELLEDMYSAGCRGIAYGIESGNQQVLDSMKKNITLEQITNAVKWAKDAGMYVSGYFMIGMLDETKETIRQTIAFAKELDLDYYGFSLVTPLPGTELYDSAVKRGLISVDEAALSDDLTFDVNANLTVDCSNQELLTFENEVFRKFTLKNFGRYFMFSPAFLKKAARVIFSLRSRDEAGELSKKAGMLLRSYWRKA